MLRCNGSHNYQFTVSLHIVLFCFLGLSLMFAFVYFSFFLAEGMLPYPCEMNSQSSGNS